MGNLRHDASNVIARIVTSTSGGPLRTIIAGRSTHATGTFPAVKGGSFGQPWESKKAELPAIELAEFGSPIHSLLSQPHRLEMFVRGARKPLIYLPDLLVVGDHRWVQDIESDRPFAESILDWRPTPGPASRRKVVIEVKDDDDRRMNDPVYVEKLDMAAEVYRRVGIKFRIIKRSRDLACADMPRIREILMDRYASVGTKDEAASVACIEAYGGCATAGQLVDRLGGAALGLGKLAALHVRRVVSLRLEAKKICDCPVLLVGDGGVIAHSPR